MAVLCRGPPRDRPTYEIIFFVDGAARRQEECPKNIIMEANPQVGDVYRQEYLKHVAEDMGEVISLDGVATVPYGSFSECVVTKDFSPLDKKSYEYKWYARGVGLVKSMDVQGGSDVSELASVTRR
jgi:hypothetical protein